MQLNHYNTNFTPQTFPITLVCDNITNAPNIGSLFRTADAFGVERIIFCGSDIPTGRKMTKTSRSTEKVVSYNQSQDISLTLKQLKQDDYLLIALEITDNSTPIHNITLNEQPIALVIGDENFGVSESVLNLCDAIHHITMYGKNSSMNVVQATNIACYEITQQQLKRE